MTLLCLNYNMKIIKGEGEGQKYGGLLLCVVAEGNIGSFNFFSTQTFLCCLMRKDSELDAQWDQCVSSESQNTPGYLIFVVCLIEQYVSGQNFFFFISLQSLLLHVVSS